MPGVRNFFVHIIFKHLFWIVKNEISTLKIITLNEEECNKFFDSFFFVFLCIHEVHKWMSLIFEKFSLAAYSDEHSLSNPKGKVCKDPLDWTNETVEKR